MNIIISGRRLEVTEPIKKYAEDKIGKVVDDLNGVIGSKGGHRCAKHHREGKHRHAVAAETRSDLARHGQLCGYFLLGVLLVKKFHR